MFTDLEVSMFGLVVPYFLATGIWILGSLFAFAWAYLTIWVMMLVAQSASLKRRLVQLLREQRVTRTTINELDAAFSGVRGYNERWRQLRRGLSVFEPDAGGTKLVTSVPVRQIFSPQDILNARINMRLVDTVPTLISSLGLLLTFLAILSGLNGAIIPTASSSSAESLAEFEKMRNGIMHLVSNLSGKFLASVFALGASAAFVLYERIVVGATLSVITRVQGILDEAIEYHSSDSILQEIHGAMVESTTRNRIVAEHLPLYIRQEVRNAAGVTLERIEGILKDLCDVVADLKTPEQSQDTSAATGALTKALEEVQQQFIQAAARQFDGVNGALKETTRTLEQMSSMLSGSSGQMVTAANALERILQDHSSTSKTQLDRTLNSLERVGGPLQESVETASRTMITSFEEASTKMQTAVSSAAATLSALADKETSGAHAISQVKEVLDTTVAQAISSISGMTATVEGFKSINSAIQASSLTIAQGSTALTSVIQSAQDLYARGDQIMQQSKELFDQNAQALNNYNQVFLTLDQSIAKIMAQLEEQIWRFHSRVEQQLQGSLKQYDELSARGYATFESAITSLSNVLTEHRNSSTTINQ